MTHKSTSDPFRPSDAASASAARHEQAGVASGGSPASSDPPLLIPLVDLAAQHGPIRAELLEACARVMASETYILGPEVSAFEAEVARYLGVERALGVSSGTDALLLALIALGIGPGDEVLVPAFSFFATAGCVARVGARPIFVDIDPTTYNLDVTCAQARVTRATKAIIPVHLFGQLCDVPALIAFAQQHRLQVIEDAAQALGAGDADWRAGSIGNFSCFSFFPTKNLGALGDAGLLTTRDVELHRRARRLRSHGAEPKYHHLEIGGNFRIDALQAALLRVKLPRLEGWTDTRRRNAQHYDRLFAQAGLAARLLRTPACRRDRHIYHQYVVQTPHRDTLQAHLRQHGIGSEVYYPTPLHLQPCFAYLGEGPGAHPVSERAAREVLALPIHPDLGYDQIERVVGVVCDLLRNLG